MYIALLGRQPALGMAELERRYGEDATSWFSDVSAKISTDTLSIEQLGGIQKAGQVVIELPGGDWRRVSMKIVQAYTHAWSGFDGKITLGISAYGFDVSPREIQQTGIILKQKLKKVNVSLRMIPNNDTALNTATSHHNKLGLSNNKVELLVVRARNGRVIVAESTGAQNITAYTKRDQERPKRDAFVGMLPPKLAQIMINLAAPAPDARILDPFCGTGVVLQEAALLGHAVYGTDLSEKMIRYSKENLDWLKETHRATFEYDLHEGDAMDTSWQGPIGAVVGETYLGQPFSAHPHPPSSIKSAAIATISSARSSKTLPRRSQPAHPSQLPFLPGSVLTAALFTCHLSTNSINSASLAIASRTSRTMNSSTTEKIKSLPASYSFSSRLDETL